MIINMGHPVRDRFLAWILGATEDLMHKKFGIWKQRIFQGLPDSVVELGPGTGANFRYYKRGTHLIAVEPNPKMNAKLRRNAEKYGLDLEIRELKAEDIDLADESTEAVVGTLVLCSVDQVLALQQVLRILKPGGRFLFMEHVGAPKGTFRRRLQGLFRRPWKWSFEGCKLDNETELALRAAGFSKIELEHFEFKGLFSVPIKHYIVGIATK